MKKNIFFLLLLINLSFIKPYKYLYHRSILDIQLKTNNFQTNITYYKNNNYIIQYNQNIIIKLNRNIDYNIKIIIQKYYNLEKKITNIIYNIANNITNNNIISTSVIYALNNNNKKFKLTSLIKYNYEGNFLLANKKLEEIKYNNKTPKLLFNYLLFESNIINNLNFYKILIFNNIDINNNILITKVKIIVEHKNDKKNINNFLIKNNYINILKNISLNSIIKLYIYDLEEYYYYFDY